MAWAHVTIADTILDPLELVARVLQPIRLGLVSH